MLSRKLLGACLCTLFISIGNISRANTYFFSSSTGDDNRTSLQAQNPLTPWKSLEKLNSTFSLINPGDSILFKRGDIFYGKIRMTKSGSASKPIIFSAYGQGNQPVISGLTTLNKWESYGNGIMIATCNDCKENDNLLILNDEPQVLGRYPNTGYLTYQSFSGNSSITSNTLSGGVNWTGAEVVVKKNDWVLDRNVITSQNGNTLNFNPTSQGSSTNNYGFFIQNDQRTLDTLGEWYFDAKKNSIMVYFGSKNPNNFTIKTSTIDTLIYMAGTNNLILDNLTIEGANKYGILINWSDDITIQNCNFNYSGETAIRCSDCNRFSLTKSTFSNSLNYAIDLSYNCLNSTISENVIKNTGCLPGMGGNGVGNYSALNPGKGYDLISNNKIYNTGFLPIRFGGDGAIVENNFIDTYGFIKDDCGGIYTWGGDKVKINKERIVRNNIITNGIGAPEGANGNLIIHGIYMDDFTSSVTIQDNTVFNVKSAGIFLHRANNITVKRNKLFDNTFGIMFHQHNTGEFYNLDIKHNQFVAKTNSQYGEYYLLQNGQNDIRNWGVLDSNYITRPVNEDNKIFRIDISGTSLKYYGLKDWNPLTSQEAHSSPAKVSAMNADQLRFEYNATPSKKSVSLDGSYTTVDGEQYYNNVTLPAYSSVILIRTPNSNIPPEVTAGKDQTLILPNNSTTLSGSATDKDGSIVSYLWEKKSGPDQFTITDPNSAVTKITNLVQGIYEFQLTATDNMGATTSAVIKISVGVTSNIAPSVSVGNDLTITLPANTAKLSGSASDEDGQIVSYRWTKTSGPEQYTIANANSATTDVSGLVAGVYQFQLTATDDKGATASATIKVSVVIAPNIPPSVSVGNDLTTTLPTNTAKLSGSASDKDGQIVSYKWTKISGPDQYNIVNANSAVTDVSGLVVGVYEFQLTATDDKGATASAKMKITVKPAPNLVPTVEVSNDTVITLPDNTVILSGTGHDPDGSIVSYHWSKISGPNNYQIVNPESSTTEIRNLTVGVYRFRLTVKDDKEDAASATVKVTVNSEQNKTPDVQAGKNVTITLPTNEVVLQGSGSDPDGEIISYEWEKVSGPDNFKIEQPGNATTQVTGLTEGVYQFQLTVTDNNGSASSDIVEITVKAAPNKIPKVSMGEDIVITLPVNSVNLTGNATDEDGQIVNYRWAKKSGPNSYQIATPNSAVTIVSDLVQGVYVFELTVTDNNGATATAAIKVTVNGKETSNKAPVVNAGNDVTVKLPVNEVSLTGSASDPDGQISSYQWTKVSGPNSYNILTPTQPSTVVKGLTEGGYTFQLKVTDNSGASASDKVNITVLPANKVPKVNAGGNVSATLPDSAVTLKGSASDPDGTIVSYNWTQSSGPGGVTITSPHQPRTSLQGLIAGNYSFVLTVIDNEGAHALDSMLLTVNAPKIAEYIKDDWLHIYPNPTPDNVTIEVTSTTPESEVTKKAVLLITDNNGRNLYQKEFTTDNQGKYHDKMNLSNLKNGAYIFTVQFHNEGIRGSKKVIKIK